MNSIHAALVALFAIGLAACGTAPTGQVTTPDGGSQAVPLDAICHAGHVDESSKIFPARNAEGKVTRYSVTPTNKIADMGNLIFDADGKLLGHDTGSEVPWDDKDFMAKENARVAALYDGAKVAHNETPLTCP